MFKERLVQLTHLEEFLDRDVFLMCHNRQSANAMIDGTMIDVLRQSIRFSKRRENVALIIQTPGGYADEALYICKFFREHYDSVDTYIVGDCYSGGTIIALSSDNIYMSPNACLGPIDVQLGYNDKRPWNHHLYGMINALNKGLKEKILNSKLISLLEENPGVLASYFQVKCTYKSIVGEYVKKHCKNKKAWEYVWDYLAELNFSHGSSLTYKRCVELGLDVQKIPTDIDKIISKIVRDAENEFGGLFSKSVLCDFYESSNGGDIIKRAKFTMGREDKITMEMLVNKSTEKLAIIETSQVGYIEEEELAVTIYGLIPTLITPIKSGWREEYNPSLVTDEENRLFEDHIDASVMRSLNSVGFKEGEVVPKETYGQLVEMTTRKCYDNVLKYLYENGADIDSMSSAEKWKAVVEYFIEQDKFYRDQEYAWFMDNFKSLIDKEASELGVDYDSLTDEEKEDFMTAIVERRIPEVVNALGISEEEFRQLSQQEQYELVIDYLLNSNE